MKKILGIIVLVVFGYANDFAVKVGVSLAPYAYFVKKIGGDFVDVTILVPEKRNPRVYDFSYKQVKIIKNLKIFVASGIPYEAKWLKRFSNANPSLRILDFEEMRCGDMVCYPWLNFEKTKEIAKKIAHYLRMVDIKNAQNYKKNLDLFLQEIDELKQKIQSILASCNGDCMLISNQTFWQNFTQNFNLNFVFLKEKKRIGKNQKCLVTPFESQKALMQDYLLSKKQIFEINPFREDWENMMIEIANFVGENNE